MLLIYGLCQNEGVYSGLEYNIKLMSERQEESYSLEQHGRNGPELE